MDERGDRVNGLATTSTGAVEGFPVVTIRGEIDISNAADVESELFAAIGNEVTGMILDLSDTSYLDSSGIRLLFDLARRLRTRGQELRVVSPEGTALRRLLAMTKVATVAPLSDDLPAAVRSLGA
jgi:anti-anti-sigma factor